MGGDNIKIEIRKYLAEIDEELILWDGFDDAIIGICEKCAMDTVVAYDKNKIIEIMINRDKMTYEEAIDYYAYNILGSYVGLKTPIVVESIDF